MYCSQVHECAGMLTEETWYEPDYDESEEMDESEVYCQFFQVAVEDEPF